MRACDWPISGLTSLPRGAISLREESWRASALGAAGAPEAAGAHRAGALRAPRDAVGAGSRRRCPDAQIGDPGGTRGEGDGGRALGGGCRPSWWESVCLCVCRSPLALRVPPGLRERRPFPTPRPAGGGTWGPRRGSGGGEGRPVSLFGYLAV